MASNVFNGLGLSRGTKLVSTNDGSSFLFIDIQAFSKPRRKNILRRILHKPVEGTPWNVYRFVCL